MKPHPFLIQHSHVPLASAMQRRRKLLALSALLCLGAVAGMPKATHAQDVWPSKPLRLIVPFTPGGVTDTSGRLIAESLGKPDHQGGSSPSAVSYTHLTLPTTPYV